VLVDPGCGRLLEVLLLVDLGRLEDGQRRGRPLVGRLHVVGQFLNVGAADGSVRHPAAAHADIQGLAGVVICEALSLVDDPV